MLAVRVTPGLAERGAMVSHALGPEGPPPCQPYSRYQALMGCQVAPRDAGSRDSRGSRRPHDPRQSHVHRRLPSPPDRRHGGNDGQQRDGHRQPNGAPPLAGLKALGVPGVPWPPGGVASKDLPSGGNSVPPCQPQPQPQRQGSADSPWVVREERLQEAATIIRASVLAYLTRRRFLRLRVSAVCIQRWFRAVRRRREHVRLRLAPATPPAGTRRALPLGAGHPSPLPSARRGSPDAAAPVWVHRDAAAATDADDGVASGEGNVGSAATTALDGQSVVAPSAPAARSQQRQLAPLHPPRSSHGHEGGGDAGADGGDAGADEDDAVFLGEELRRPGYTRVFLPRRPATAGGPPAAAAAPSPDALSYRSDDEWSWRRGDSLEGGHGTRADAAVSLRRGRRLLSPDREFRYSVGTYNSSVFGYGSTDIPSALLFEDSDGAPDEDEILASRRGCVTSGAGVRPYHSSHLSMRSGPMGLWKRRWCVLRGDTFMWFRTKQDSLKAGWLLKLQGGGGAARAPGARGAVWKRRWFVLRRDALLCYDSDKQQRPRGVLEILKAKAIVDNPESENGIDVVLPERVYHLRADSPEESSEWFSVLSRVHSASLAELREMRNELANPDNAVETLDVGMIDAVCASENPERACRFSVLSGGRMLRFSAESPREALTWMSLLQRSKGDARVQGQEFVVRGWLYMEVASPSARRHSSRRRSMRLRGATAAAAVAAGSTPAPAAGDATALKRRWVVLTESSLDVYRTSERGAAKISSLLLTGQLLAGERARLQPRLPALHGAAHRGLPLGRGHPHGGAGQATRHHADPPAHTAHRGGERGRRGGGADVRAEPHPAPLAACAALAAPAAAAWRLGPTEARRVEPRLDPGRRGAHVRHRAGPGRAGRPPAGVPGRAAGLPGAAAPAGRGLLPAREADGAGRARGRRRRGDDGGAAPVLGAARLCELLDSAQPARPAIRALPSQAGAGPARRRLRRSLRRLRARRAAAHTGARLRGAVAGGAARRGRRRGDERHRALPGRRAVPRLRHQPHHGRRGGGEAAERPRHGGHAQRVRAVRAARDGRGARHRGTHAGGRRARIFREHRHRRQSARQRRRCRWERWGRGGGAVASVLPHLLLPGPRPRGSRQRRVRLHVRARARERGAGLAAAARRGALAAGGAAPAVRARRPAGRAAGGPAGRAPPGQRARRVPRGTAPGPPGRPAPVGRARRGGERRCGGDSRTSSFSGVVGPCGPGGEELAALPEALAAARAGIASAWLRLQGVGQEQAMARYMALVREWPGYGSTVFDVECVEGGFPRELWLGVGARALNVYCRGDAVPIETIPYEHVLAFGSPEAGVYRVATRSRTLAFRTAQVVEIAKLMKVYVARLVRRHHVQRSLCSSQGSWSSACP